ncbi:cytochrome P450 67 [Phakopsora pachyrhizi]|nr:cytochrome P450 67 [Phakopsora pachyrhizi]
MNEAKAVHLLFRKHEPTIFEYIYFQSAPFFLLRFLGLTSASSLSAIALLNLFLGTQIIFYRLAWHHLRKFPGPKIAAITQGWILKETYSGRTRFTMKKLTEKYGDWVRIGPNELLTTSTEALGTILGPKGWPKGSSYDSGITKSSCGGDSVLTIKTLSEHAKRRRIWDKAFTQKAIFGYLPSIEVRIEQLMDVVEDNIKRGEDVDLCLQIGYFVYDTMCDMAFGSTGAADLLKTQKDEHHILEQMGRVVQQAGILRNVPWLTPLVKIWPSAQTKEQVAFREFTKTMFLKRWKQGLGKQIDVFHYLLGEDTETGTRLTISELAADSTLLIITGADTTRMVLIAFFMYLLQDRGCMEKLRGELEAASDLSPPTLSQLPYLNACLYETMRLQPPSPSNIQRVCPPGDAVIDGFFIPEGTKVRFSMFAMHRDKRYFDYPDEFRPERWLKKTENPFEKSFAKNTGEKLNEKAFFPFLIGPGSCVAKSLAWLEMRLVAANLISNYEISFGNGFDPHAFENTWTDAYLLMIKEPLKVKFSHRLKD